MSSLASFRTGSLYRNWFGRSSEPTPVPTGNSASAARLSTHLGDKWHAYDALPAAIRQALAQAAVDLCPHNISAAYHRVLDATKPLGLEHMAIELYLEHFDLAQLGEIDLFSSGHVRRYGRPTPHVAAYATRLTEDTRRPPRPGRRHRRAGIGCSS